MAAPRVIDGDGHIFEDMPAIAKHHSSRRILLLSICSEPSNRDTAADLPVIAPANLNNGGGKGSSRAGLCIATAIARTSPGVDIPSSSATK